MESAENREQSPQANQSEEKHDSESLSKVETIKLLNDSIDQLEATIQDISQNSAKNLPSTDSINTLLNTTQELADSVTSAPDTEVIKEETEIKVNSENSENPETVIKSPAAESIPAQASKPEPAKDSQSEKTSVNPSKKEVTKSIAPTKDKKKPSLVIVGVIAASIVAVALSWLYFPQLKSTVFSILNSTEISTIEQVDLDSKTTDIPEVNPDRKIDSIPPDISSSDLPKVETEPEVTAPVAIPQDLVAPGRAKNLKIATVEPELTFTPEQTLIAALQTKLAEITVNYESNLFQNIQVDLPQTSLLIEVTDSWYELNESRQTKLTNEILKRSRQLNFSKLQFQDSTGTLVARNPVVGDRIIIIESIREN